MLFDVEKPSHLMLIGLTSVATLNTRHDFYSRRRGVVVLLRPWCSGIVAGFGIRSEIQNFVKISLVFVRKYIRNLKCYVAPRKSLVRKRCAMVDIY